MGIAEVSVPEAEEIIAALAEMGLGPAGGQIRIARLTGGVSCDVHRVTIDSRTICVKRALPKLRVKADWRAPAERSSTEVSWIRLAAQISPGCVPAILGENATRHMFAMEFLPPDAFPLWKSRLADGKIDPAFAAQVGECLAKIHGATAGRQEIAVAFANDDQFRALRLDPFFLHAAAKHPRCAPMLRRLADGVARARIALMHGDISPKNILCGSRNPVFLDAETACYGDPAFDLAFCLNHVLLKCVWHPEWCAGYLDCFTNLSASYLESAHWEEKNHLEARTSALLPALMLARVDGKSPAEYLSDEQKRNFVRGEALNLLRSEPATLAAIRAAWSEAASHEFG